MGRSILITGATGGLGLALVEAACARGLKVLATGRSDQHQARLVGFGARFLAADLTDPRAAQRLCEGQDGVIHAAALSSSWGPRAAFQAANVDATSYLLERAQQQGATRFVYISSPSIFAAMRDRLAIGPNDLPTSPPLNDYAHTKLIGERMVLAASRQGFAALAIRPRAIVGPDDQVLLPKLAQLARRTSMPLPGGGRSLIELTDVRDVASATLAALDRADEVAGMAFNISGGQPIQVRELAQRLAATLGLKPRLLSLPLPLAHVLASCGEGLARALNAQNEPVLTRYTLATLGYSQTFDLEPARQHLGWVPKFDGVATLLEQALRMRS
jgi:2-alkyl-3-oxoalkanoate reductase